jgi:D-amino-acid dehydrogenase
MDALCPLGHETLDLFDEIVESEGLDCGYRRDGYYEVCRTERGLEALRHDVRLMEGHGYAPREMEGAALREALPALREGTVGGVFFPEAGSVDPLQFVTGMAAAVERHGGSVRTGVGVAEVMASPGGVKGVRTAEGDVMEGEAVVVATGAYSRALLGRLGLRLPVQAGKGYHKDLPVGRDGAPTLEAPCILSETSVFCTPMGGRIRFAGTMEFSGVNHDIRRPRLDQLTRAADRYLEGIGDARPLSEWCGLRPVTPDGLPAVGPVPGIDGLHVATGHSMLGLTLGPVTGRLVADAVLDGEVPRGMEALAPDRF